MGGKTIRQFLIDGQADGRWVSEFSNWTECIAFISKDNNLNKAHIKYLEKHFYNLAKKSKRYEMVNSNIPAEDSISEMDRAEMDDIYTLQNRSGIKASGKLVSEGFVVLKGTKVTDSVSLSLSKSVVDKRQILFDRGIIDVNYIFTQDWTFTSPTFAAEIVVGCSVNGRNAWKNKNNGSFKEVKTGDIYKKTK